MNVIEVLPQRLASQIAAGEVIDRPASVVRELVDNAIDAGTDRVIVEVQNGGRTGIKVADRGVGMSREDLALCVERHATSKIRSAEDLFAIRTLGFRGEALPSIASVARFAITSRPHHELAAFRLEMEGGGNRTIIEAGAPPGTTVEVRDLFFNLPARRKFLRADRTEGRYVVDTVTQMAMAYPEIAFDLKEDGREVLSLPASDNPVVRLSALVGREVAEAMADLKGEWGGFKVRVFTAPGEFGRKRSDRLLIYVNRRYIRDRLIHRAVMDAYGQRLMGGQYPQALIFIEMDPEEVDVNVHPTKQEVRFRNAQAVFRAVSETVRSSFGAPLTASFAKTASPQAPAPPPPVEQPLRFRTAEPERSYGPMPSDSPQWRFVPEEEPEVPAGDDLSVSVIGQLGRTYILCETGEGLLMVDQHAAHERVVYEALKGQVRDGRLTTQAHLFPLEIELGARDARTALEQREQLLRVGIELDHFGGNTFLVRAVPAILKDREWRKLLTDLLALLDEGRSLGAEVVLDRMLITMACHGAIRAGDRLVREEMERLLQQLKGLEVPDHCPHGRPILRRIRYTELERMFKRTV